VLSAPDLRHALGLFATGVTIVSAVDRATDEPRGMTANAFMSGSLHPPLILISVKLNAHLHDVLSAERSFGVSVLPASLEREARRFAGLPRGAHEPGPRFVWHGRVPVVDGAMAWFSADVVDRHVTGDHTLFVGEVREFAAADPEAEPLVFVRSQFARVTARADSVPLATDPWGGVLDLWG
jgi:flavin reductase (DIM6/NTAB) family NADH-FMN oxidoreductase RutF